jgi:glycosyltransferase involved in cell wall biosynthesis
LTSAPPAAIAPREPPNLVSIVLPVHNQADHVEVVVREYEVVLARVRAAHEMILVTNGCRDRSVDICRTLAEELPHVRTVEVQSSGWGRAVRRGIMEARGDIVCYTNLARTSPEHLALLVLYAVAFPGTVVKANRKIRESLWRRLGSLLYNLECRLLFDLACWDINGTPKVFPRQLQNLFALERDDDLIDLEFVATCRRESYHLIEVPIFSTRRHGGRSTTGCATAVRLYLGAWRFRRAWAPRP